METYGYWLMSGIGVAVSFALCLILCKLKKANFKNILIFLPIATLFGFIGAKLFGILSYGLFLLVSRQGFGDVLKNSGWVFYGGMFGFLITTYLFKKELKNKEKDIIICAFTLFHSIARIGCYFAGCCYGEKIAVQLLESGLVFLIFILLILLFIKGKQNLIPIYLISYAFVRFITEFYRADIIRGVYILSFSQWVSIILVLVVIFKFLRGKKNAKNRF